MDALYLLGIVCIAAGGVALAVQAGTNSVLSLAAGSAAFSAVVSFASGTVICAAYLLVDALALGRVPSRLGITGNQALAHLVTLCPGAAHPCAQQWGLRLVTCRAQGTPPHLTPPQPDPHLAPASAGAPWWSWVGGVLGALYVIAVIVFARRLGSGTLTAVFVCAQLLTAAALDSCGAVGFARREVSWQRCLGVAFMIAGVVLVERFPGALASKDQP